MQQARSHSISGSWRSLAAMIAALAVAPAIARAQHVNGALGVTLTVLPPVTTQAVELLAFSVDRSGFARLETTAPVASSVSLIVMATVASSVDGAVPVEQAPMLVAERRPPEPRGCPPDSTRTCAPRSSYRVDLGRLPVGSGQHDATVRIAYLIVSGT